MVRFLCCKSFSAGKFWYCCLVILDFILAAFLSVSIIFNFSCPVKRISTFLLFRIGGNVKVRRSLIAKFVVVV